MGATEYAWKNEAEQNSLRRRQQDPKATYYPKGELVIVDKNNFYPSNSIALTYTFTIHATQPSAEKRYYIDA